MRSYLCVRRVISDRGACYGILSFQQVAVAARTRKITIRDRARRNC